MNHPNEGNCQAARRSPLLIQWIGRPPSKEQPFGLLSLALGTEVATYFVLPLDSDFGRAFELTKLIRQEKPLVYHVLLDGQRSTCDCKGFECWGHCKHVDALTMLAEVGQLHRPVRTHR